jgi:predicted hydrolase (HD superfamily)
MVRLIGMVCVVAALAILVGTGDAGAQKNQMVKGTIKSVDSAKDLLVVKQKVKNETVDRELSIVASTEFVIQNGSDKKELSGKQGLQALEGITGAVGANVQVKCDKDVNVLKVTVKIK